MRDLEATKTAIEIKRLKGWAGDARLFQLSEPVTCGDGKETCFVIVSAAVALYSGPETYIFAADRESDDPLDWCELEGSFRGALDHRLALAGLGFTVQTTRHKKEIQP